MENYMKWWNSLPIWKQRKLAEDMQWTTPKEITDYQIELIYKETQSY